MSQDDKTAALAAHLGTLAQKVWAPAFFGALADRGIVPATEKQAEHLARMGEMLILADQAENAKQAEADGDFYAAAADHLERLLGGAPAAPAYADAGQVKRAAARFLADPEVAAAAAAVGQATFAG